MKLAIVLFAVVVAVNAHPGLVDPWAAPQVAVHAPQVIPWPAPQAYAPVHSQVYAAPAPIIKVAHPVIAAHAPVAVHQQVVKVHQSPPIPALIPQPLNIKVPHTQSVRLPVGPVHIPHPHLIGFQAAAPEPQHLIAKHAVIAKPVHVAPVHVAPVHVSAPVWQAPAHPW